MITLGELLPEAGLPAGDADRMIAGITADSRAVRQGCAFFAIPGTRTDGLSFAPAAIAAGACVVVAESTPSAPPDGATFVKVANVRLALATAAARFYPRQPGTIVAVTGTSGKTSVAAFTRQIWSRLGHAAAALGTTGVVRPDGVSYGSLTTPDPVTLHRTLDQLAGDGVSHLAMEASSHGLDQYRLDGVRLAAGAFTNLSRDHLDYHPDLESYFLAKMRLFNDLLPPGTSAVIDADTDHASRVTEICARRGLNIVTTGAAGQTIRLLDFMSHPAGAILRLACDGRTYDVELPLSGRFMASNALVAAGLCVTTGSDPVPVFGALAHLSGAPGRLERVAVHHGAPIFIDYAHKPDALEKVLDALRPIVRARLMVVFGCGGDRDAGKRPIMGEIATRGADLVIVTDDNPRSEDPARIRAAILAAAPGAIEIGDRESAIRAAIAMLGEGDVLVIAGKGHETGQIVGDRTLPFSDHEAVRNALGSLSK